MSRKPIARYVLATLLVLTIAILFSERKIIFGIIEGNHSDRHFEGKVDFPKEESLKKLRQDLTEKLGIQKITVDRLDKVTYFSNGISLQPSAPLLIKNNSISIIKASRTFYVGADRLAVEIEFFGDGVQKAKKELIETAHFKPDSHRETPESNLVIISDKDLDDRGAVLPHEISRETVELLSQYTVQVVDSGAFAEMEKSLKSDGDFEGYKKSGGISAVYEKDGAWSYLFYTSGQNSSTSYNCVFKLSNKTTQCSSTVAL